MKPVVSTRGVLLAVCLVAAACGAPDRGPGAPDVGAAPRPAPPLAGALEPSSATLWGPSRTHVKERRDDGRLLVEREGGVMGTSLRLQAIGTDEAALARALIAAEAELRRVEDAMTDWRPSPLLALNAAAGRGPTPVSRELAQLVERALIVSRLTGGAFDPTWRGVGKLWDLKAVPPRVPSAEAIATGLTFVDHRRVVVDLSSEPPTIDLPAGFELGLGGIAKGHGVARAMAVLVEHGVEHAIVDAGGDLQVLGRHFDVPWEIAISHPRRRGDVMAVVPVSNTCVVTSGDYERFFEIDGVRYHHILDPRTGRPSTGCMSATVVGPDPAVCDGLATALCVMGPEQGLALIERSGDYHAICVGLDGEVRATSGLRAAVVAAPGPR